GVARDQGVESPVDHAHTELEQRLTLKLLEPAADAAVPQLGAHGEHVGPVDEPSVLDAGHAEHEAEQAVLGIEGAGRYAAEPLTDLEDGGRDALAEVGAPGLVREGHAGGKVFVGAEVADVEAGGRHVRGAAGDRGAAGVGRRLCGHGEGPMKYTARYTIVPFPSTNPASCAAHQVVHIMALVALRHARPPRPKREHGPDSRPPSATRHPLLEHP